MQTIVSYSDMTDDYLTGYKQFIKKMKKYIINPTPDVREVERSTDPESILDSWNALVDDVQLLIEGVYYNIVEDDEGIHLNEI